MNHPRRRHNPETDAAFAEVWSAGTSTMIQMAEQFNVAPATLYEWRVRLGLPGREARHKEDEKALICDLWKKGHSASEIAQKIGGGKSRNAIIGVVHRAGLSGVARANATWRQHNNFVRSSQSTFTAAMDAELRKMAAEGISRATAARRMKVSDSRLRDRITRLGLFWAEPKSSADSPWQRKPKLSDREREAATIAGQALLANATDEAGPDAIRLLERRTFSQCAWPVGTATGADQLCCGKPIAEGHTGIRQSYCAGHGMRAVSRTFVKEPEVPRERAIAPVPRGMPANDDLWDVAA